MTGALFGSLQALADQHRIAFVLRDYGIMATSLSRAAHFDASVIPEGLALAADDR